jgi:hypothetical protein
MGRLVITESTIGRPMIDFVMSIAGKVFPMVDDDDK